MPVTVDEIRALASTLPRSGGACGTGEVLAAERVRHALQLDPRDLEAIDHEEMRDLVENAWSRCVPKYVAKGYAEAQGYV